MNSGEGKELFSGLTFDQMLGLEDTPSEGNPLELDIETLTPFPNQPFHLYNEEEMEKMVESIRENGVISPIIVRPKEGGKYEIISGHNRVEACRRAGIVFIPSYVREVNDDTAVILMVDSNLHQREQLLPSEKARAYQMKKEALHRSGGRYALNCDPSEHNLYGLRTRDVIGADSGDSGAQVQRYLRLNHLTPALMQKVDNKKLNMRSAVELSHLTPEEQKTVQAVMEKQNVSPSVAQAQSIRHLSKNNTITAQNIEAVLEEKKSAEKLIVQPQPKKKKRHTDRTVLLRWSVLSPFFSDTATDAEIEQTIIALLQKNEKRKTTKNNEKSK
ncbi:MAG: ParB/RepB/Spo0J family partition protein [Clostridia bacterium]|nr:ParB/RepB/Spo0J family partition protein [Clostridia bacterium]